MRIAEAIEDINEELGENMGKNITDVTKQRIEERAFKAKMELMV